MGVVYKTIDGEKVSRVWYALLSCLRKEGVVFHVNEGHRTIARQWYFYRLWKSGRGNLAAFPSPFAPHIRSGRFDHAVDFNGAENVRKAAAKHGVTLTRTVRWPNGTVREEWHLEANARQLLAFYRRWQKRERARKRAAARRAKARKKGKK